MAIRDNQGRTLISCREAAELYPCSMGYIRRLVRDGRLSSQEVGGTYMVDRAEVLTISRRKDTGRLKKRSEGFRAG